MAITMPTGVKYDRTFPLLVDSTSMSRYGNRAISFMEYADPVWQIPIRVMSMSNADRQKVEAFIRKARNGLVTVHYVPVHVCLPQAYWGDPNNAAVLNTGLLGTITGNTITVTSVSAGLKLTAGDLIGFTQGDYNYIATVADSVTAATTTITINIEPYLPSYITTGATVVWKNPKLNTRLLPGSFSPGEGVFPTASFELIEVPK